MARGKVKVSRGTYGLWATQHLDDRWTLEARLVRQRDTLSIAEVRVIPRSKPVHISGQPWWEKQDLHGRPTERVPEGGVPATLLRRIALGPIYDEVRRMLDVLADWR